MSKLCLSSKGCPLSPQLTLLLLAGSVSRLRTLTYHNLALSLKVSHCNDLFIPYPFLFERHWLRFLTVNQFQYLQIQSKHCRVQDGASAKNKLHWLLLCTGTKLGLRALPFLHVCGSHKRKSRVARICLNYTEGRFSPAYFIHLWALQVLRFT